MVLALPPLLLLVASTSVVVLEVLVVVAASSVPFKGPGEPASPVASFEVVSGLGADKTG